MRNYMSKKCCILCVLVLCLIIFGFWACLSCDGSIALPAITIDWKYIKDVSDCCCCGGGNGNLWAAISGIASLIMGILAFLAWRQSIKARLYTSFENLYASLLAQQRNLFESTHIIRTLLKTGHTKDTVTTVINGTDYSVDIEKRHSITTNFCNYYSDIANAYKGQTFDFPTISRIWDDFVSQLVYRANFLNCFKFLYNIIDTIEASDLSDKDKAIYMERTQALLNQDELFCYYINLIVSTGGYNQKHLATLRKYNFFKDLVNSDLYREILHSSIASSLKQMMRKDS